jgi:hypothetical protein
MSVLVRLQFALVAVVLAQTAVRAADAAADPKADADGWYTIFDGTSLDGWRAAETPESFKVEDGVLIVGGERGHLFYDGPVNDHDFTNFEFKAEVMTEPQANSGIYFHTQYQDEDWPHHGYECQVNNSHPDPRRTPSLYGIKDVADTPAKDHEWFEYHIKVEGKHITIAINGKTYVDYEEPADPPEFQGRERKLSHGTFAIQAHDPGSIVHFRNIRVKPLD